MAFKVPSKIFLINLHKAVCTIGKHILYSYSHFQKVFLPAFTIPEMESEKNYDYICRLILSIYVIIYYYLIYYIIYIIFFNKSLQFFLTFSRVIEKYICYPLVLCSRSLRKEASEL